ncbi:MAG: excisionase family DNA-binding protein [Nitrospirales bacterium]
MRDDLHTLLDQMVRGITDAPTEQLPALMAHLAACQSAVAARLLNGHQNGATPRDAMPTEPDALLTIDEVAKRLNVPKGNAYELVRQHKLGSVRLGKYVRVAPDMLAQYVATLAASSQAATMAPLMRRK